MSQAARNASGALSDLLNETRRRLRRAAFAEAATLVAAGVALALIMGTLASWLGGSGALLVGLEAVTIVATIAAAVLRYGRGLGRATRDETAVALWLDRAVGPAEGAPGFRSAVELARDRGQYGESPGLATRAIEQAADRGQAVDPAEVVRAEARPPLMKKVLGTAIGGLVVVVLWLVAPGHLTAAFGAVTAIDQIGEALAPPPPEPRLGDIRITYRYPAYAKRPSRTVRATDGAIHALPGTEVLIETRSRRPLAQATLIVSHGDTADADTSRTAVEIDGRQLKATLVVTRGGHYRFRAITAKREVLEERRTRPIELELDAPPEVKMLSPTESPLEVNENDRVDVVLRTSDDFGLGDISIAWRVLGTSRQGKQLISTGARGKRHFAGKGHFELSKLSPRPGDRISYWVEATDNDTVNGPKVGASVTKELRIYSEDAHHREVMAMAKKALDELVHVLGDNLERPIEYSADPKNYSGMLDTNKTTAKRAKALSTQMGEVVAAIRDDPRGEKAIATAFSKVRSQLRSDARRQSRALNDCAKRFARNKRGDEWQTKRTRLAQSRMIGRLEINAVYLDDLLKNQRLADAQSLMKQLRAEQQRLRELMEAYKDAPTEEKRAELMKAIDEVKKRIRELMEQLSQMRGSMPQDFVNQDAIPKDQMQTMDRLQEMIEKGDLEGALEALDQMLNKTDRMMAQMDDSRQELGDREYAEIKKKARELMKSLNELEKKQRDLAARTDRHAEKVLERMKKRLGDSKSFVKKQLERLERVDKHLERAEPGARNQTGGPFDQLKRRLNDTRRAFEAKDFGSAAEMIKLASQLVMQIEADTKNRAKQAKRFGDFIGNAEKLEEASTELKKSQPVVQKIIDDLEKLMPQPNDMLTPQERKKHDGLSKEQSELRKKSEELQRMLQQLGAELPMIGDGMMQIAGEIDGAMGEAQGALGQGDAPGAQGPQRKSLDGLNKLREGLQQSGGQGPGGSGMPMPFTPPGGGRPGGQRPGGRSSAEKVEIPKPEQYEAPAEFRQEILEAAKQGTAEAYKEAVRQYYEEIVK